LNPNNDAEIMTSEIFGPILPVYTFGNIDEPIKFINDGDKPLAIYYMGDQHCQNAKRVQNETSSGAFMTNEAMM
jgi:acyl-CoA reductase-like NAD-dependent aldehyde dehydrogenase